MIVDAAAVCHEGLARYAPHLRLHVDESNEMEEAELGQIMPPGHLEDVLRGPSGQNPER